MRLSDMEMGLEEANVRADQRARDTERRLAKQPEEDPARKTLGPEDEVPPLPVEEPEDDLLPPEEAEQPAAAADQSTQQTQDQELLAATKAWLSGEGEMPEQFNEMKFEWTNANGVLRRATLKELQEGELRQSDYQRSMNELRNFHQQVQFKEQANNQFWQDVRDPAKMLEEFEDRDLGEVFHQAAVQHSIRRQKMKQIAEAAGFALMQQYGYAKDHADVVNAVRQTMQMQLQNQKTEIENRKLLKHNRMFAQMQQQQQQQQQRQVRLQDLSAQINPLIAPALKSAGVRNSPANSEAFWKHLTAYVAGIRDWDGNVRRKHCIEAAKMVREELEDLAAARAPKKPAPQSKAMGPSKLSSSGTAQPTVPERKRLSDMQNDPRFGFG